MSCVVAVVAGVLVTTVSQPMAVTIVVAALLVAVVVTGLEFGPAMGAIAAVAAAAAGVALTRAFGVWDGSEYVHVASMTLAMLVAGLASGTLQSRLRLLSQPRLSAERRPVNGSLGLLHPLIGEDRLAEEIERAAYTGRSLSVVWIRVRLLGPARSQPDRGRVLRVVTRTVESLFDVVHLPVGYSDADTVGILVETDEDAAHRLIERIRGVAAAATLLVGSDRTRERFNDLATIDVGLAIYPRDGDTATQLLEVANARISPDRSSS